MLVSMHNNPWADWVRFWYTPECCPPLDLVWLVFQGPMPLYWALTGVSLGCGDSTLFCNDCWTMIGHLTTVLPALYSHCMAPDISVATTFAIVSIVLPVQRHLNAVAEAQLFSLHDSLGSLRPMGTPDYRAGNTQLSLQSNVPDVQTDWVFRTSC